MIRVPIRGGNWNNGAAAGVRALNLNNARSNSNTNIGVRPASEVSPKPPAHVAAGQRHPQKDDRSSARRRNSKQAARAGSARERSVSPS